MELFIPTLKYVIEAQYFWASMGLVTATGMFVGALLYNGNLSDVRKGVVTVLSYFILLVWTTLVRLMGYIQKDQLIPTKMTFAGILTIIFITFFWIIGVSLGTFILSKRQKKVVE